MKYPLILLLALLVSSTTYGQLAKDYLYRDSTRTLVYKKYNGDTVTVNFKKELLYNSDTVCIYERGLINKKKRKIYFVYNGRILTEGSRVLFGEYDGKSGMDRSFKIVEKGQTRDTSYVVSFDMDVSEFDEQTRFSSSYTTQAGKIFKNVIILDQFNKTSNFHYITVFAPHIGVVEKGGDELLFIGFLDELQSE